MEDQTKAWLRAGNTLLGNPLAQVRCPACDGAMLVVSDVLVTRAFERMMSCPQCGAKNLVVQSGAIRPA